MAVTPEGRVKATIKKLLDAYASHWLMPVTGGYGSSGEPDFVACVNGWFIGIEAKAGAGTTTLLQDRRLASIRKAGGIALVVNERNLGELEAILADLYHRQPYKREPSTL